MRRQAAAPERQARRVVVFRTGHLGDTVCAIPAFRLLRKHFAAAKLILLCDRPAGGKVAAADVIEHLGIFDDIVSYQSGRGLATMWELFRLVRQLAPDLLACLPQVDRTATAIERQRRFFRLAGVRHTIGFEALDRSLAWHPTEADRLIVLLNSAGIPGVKSDYDLPVDAPAKSAAREKLAAYGLDWEAPFAVFCGGGKMGTQRWPLERYAQVLRALAAKHPMPIIGVGSPAEVDLYRRLVLPGFPELAIPSAPLAITELVELLRSATLFIGNDTGPMHLAAAVGCPVAVVMSARNLPGRWDPDVAVRLILRHRTPCEGCRLDECIVHRHHCLLSIGVEECVGQMLPFVQSLVNGAACPA